MIRGGSTSRASSRTRSLSSGGPDGRKTLLTGRARSGRFHLQRIGPLERVRDDGSPRGGLDAPGSVLDELRGKAQRAVESAPFFTPADEALQLSPGELLLDVTRAHISTPERPARWIPGECRLASARS